MTEKMESQEHVVTLARLDQVETEVDKANRAQKAALDLQVPLDHVVHLVLQASVANREVQEVMDLGVQLDPEDELDNLALKGNRENKED